MSRGLQPRSTPLLNLFLWLCLAASALALAGGAAGVYDPGILAPYVALSRLQYALVAVSALVAAVSVIALRRDQDWGMTGFVTAVLAVFSGLAFTGAPLQPAAGVLLLPVLLVLLKAWYQRGSNSEEALERLLACALETEPADPPEALDVYAQLDELNQEVDPRILLAGAISMPAAYLLADQAAQRLTQYQEVAAIAIMVLVGLGPMTLMWSRRYIQIKARSLHAGRRVARAEDPHWLSQAWTAIPVMPLVLFADMIQLAFVALITAVVIMLLVLPYGLYRYATAGGPILAPPAEILFIPYDIFFALLMVLITLVMLSEFRLKPFSLDQILKDIRIGLQLNGDRVFSFIANNATGLLAANAVTASLTVLYDDRVVGILSYLFVGALLGWEYCKAETNPLIGTLSQMGTSRCLLKLGRKREADFSLYVRMRDTGRHQPYGIKNMGYVLMEILAEKPDVRHAGTWLDEAAEDLRPGTPYYAQRKDNYDKIRAMLMPLLPRPESGRRVQPARG